MYKPQLILNPHKRQWATVFSTQLSQPAVAGLEGVLLAWYIDPTGLETIISSHSLTLQVSLECEVLFVYT